VQSMVNNKAPSRASRPPLEPDLLIPRQYTRGVALGVVLLLLFGCSWTIWILARPLYWKLYAEVIHRYQPDPQLTFEHAAYGAGGDHRLSGVPSCGTLPPRW
jgi:hypothetical protein